MLKLKKGKFPNLIDFTDRLQSISKKSSKVYFGADGPLYRLVVEHDGAMAVLAIIGSMVAHNNDCKTYPYMLNHFKNVHIWRFVDSCERCNGGKSRFGVQFETHHALYYFLLLGFEQFKADELVQELLYSILKDLGY